jgi:hypothetical protein
LRERTKERKKERKKKERKKERQRKQSNELYRYTVQHQPHGAGAVCTIRLIEVPSVCFIMYNNHIIAIAIPVFWFFALTAAAKTQNSKIAMLWLLYLIIIDNMSAFWASLPT